MEAPSSFHSKAHELPFSVFFNVKLLREEMKDPQLTSGQDVRSMAAIIWSPSQRRTGAEGKQGNKYKTSHPHQETYSLSQKV